MPSAFSLARLGVALSALLLALAPPAAADDRDVSTGTRGPAPGAEARIDPGAPRVRPGMPFPGVDTVTEAEVNRNATGAPARDLPIDPLHPDLLEAMELSPETIVGWDTRIRNYTTGYPARAIVYIQYAGFHLCTGFMVSRNTVVTAGHCLHGGGPGGQWRQASRFRVFPGRNGRNAPYGSCGVTRLHAIAGWTRDRNPNFDYGAMRLDCNIGDTVGWFGVYSPNDRMLTDAPSIVIGYSGDKAQTQWGSADRVRRVERRMVCYRNDTVGGNSGGPVWNGRNNGLFTTGAWAYAVHAYGIGGPVCGGAGNQMNGGVRIIPVVRDRILNWIDRR